MATQPAKKCSEMIKTRSENISLFNFFFFDDFQLAAIAAMNLLGLASIKMEMVNGRSEKIRLLNENEQTHKKK